MTKIKRMGARLSPCLTPLVERNCSSVSPTLRLIVTSVYRFLYKGKTGAYIVVSIVASISKLYLGTTENKIQINFKTKGKPIYIP
jgi:hypothetical protein